MRGRWPLVVAVAALALGAGLASSQMAGPSTVEQSKCYECHSTDGKVPEKPMGSLYTLELPASLVLEPGNPTPLPVTVRSTWTATLTKVQVRLDLTKAPALAFDAGPPPTSATRSGNLPFEPGEADAPERSARLTLDVPQGATAVRFALKPTAAEQPADLTMRLWAPGADLAGDPTFDVDQQGLGGAEVLHLPTAAQVASAGYGTWTLEAAQPGVLAGGVGGAGGLDLSAVQDQPFDASVAAWFNLTGERVAFQGSPDTLRAADEGGPETTEVEFPLFVRRAVTGNQSVRFEVTAHAHYTHPAQFGALDDLDFVRTFTVPLSAPPADDGTADPDGGGNATDAPTTPVELNFTPLPPEPDTAAAAGPAWRMDKVSEAVGYLAAFLLASALVTGGVFGNASKRGLNHAMGGARRRIAFHNVTSYAILLAALVHAALFVAEALFHWSVGLLWGGAATAMLLVLGATGAFQAHLVRGIGFGAWRVVHYASALLCLAATLAHIGLDGIHFTELQEDLGWKDPLVERFAPSAEAPVGRAL